MALLDRRHRWGEPQRDGSRVTRVCRACGRAVTYDTLIPEFVADELRRHISRPNPYRTMFR